MQTGDAAKRSFPKEKRLKPKNKPENHQALRANAKTAKPYQVIVAQTYNAAKGGLWVF